MTFEMFLIYTVYVERYIILENHSLVLLNNDFRKYATLTVENTCIKLKWIVHK